MDAATMSAIGVGFGTAALGNLCYDVVLEALAAGFRAFDTAEENDWWYNQKAVGAALKDFFTTTEDNNDDECVLMEEDEDTKKNDDGAQVCVGGRSKGSCRDLRVSTKIPPWELTSSDNIRSNAARSRQELVGFCDAEVDGTFPLDVYFIHAPECWKGWHTKCDNPPKTMDLRSIWLALEAVVGLDHSARRIGLSNVQPWQLRDIIQFTKERQARGQQQQQGDGVAPPRLPDIVQIYADPIRPAEEMRQICRENGIEFLSYSTLGTQHHMKTGQNPVLSSPIVQGLAEKHGRSTAEVVLSWALQNDMSVIPRSRKSQHIRELARLLPKDKDASPADSGFLDAEDLLRMDSIKG